MGFRFFFFYYLFGSPWGWLFLVVMIFLIGCCVMGVVDFKKKEKQLSPSLDVDHTDEIQKIREFLGSELDGTYDVSYFDGAFQVFTTPNSELDDEMLYKKLRLRFPQHVFGIHRTLHVTAD